MLFWERAGAEFRPWGRPEEGNHMSTTDETKPAGKSKRRKGKADRNKKAAPPASLPETPAPAVLKSPEQIRQPQPVRAKSPKVDPPPAVEEPVAAVVAPPATDGLNAPFANLDVK